MRIYARVAAVAVGIVLMLFLGMNPTAFTQSCNLVAGIVGPSTGTVDQNLIYQANSTGLGCRAGKTFTYTWSLSSKPEGAPAWTASEISATLTPKVAGDYVIRLEVTYDTSKASADQKLTVTGQSSQSQPPSQQPPQTTSGVLERALIIGLDSGNQLRTFPGRLVVSAGGLRLTLTSLDQTLTVVLRRQGAEVGTATVLVEARKLATMEVTLAQGVYDLLNQATSSPLGQIEAR